MKRVFFGTDGIRGPYEGPLIHEAFLRRLGAAAGRLVRRRTGSSAKALPVLVGRDTRASGEALEAALLAGLAGEGARALCLGVLPTPAVSLAVRQSGAPLGMMLTASHNPASDNGIKFFGPGGFKLSDEEEAGIEALLPPEAGNGPVPPRDFRAGAGQVYVESAVSLLGEGALAGWKIVLDAAHGAAWRTSPDALRCLGADLVVLGVCPDGSNINAGVGSEHPEALCRCVRETGARLGIAHDGDADRVVFCDERGGLLDGDEVLTLLALDALAEGRLPGGTLVVTAQSNLGVDLALEAAGGRVCRTAIGDRYVAERMRAEGAALGGECSGHFIFSDLAPTGDGLAAAVKLLAVLRAREEPLSQLRRALRKFPQLTGALAVQEKPDLAQFSRIQAARERAEIALGPRGRVLLRYSGTEPKVRLLVEGQDAAEVAFQYEQLRSALRLDLGAK